MEIFRFQRTGSKTFFEPPPSCASQEEGGSNQVDHGYFKGVPPDSGAGPPAPASSPCPEGEDKRVMRSLEVLKDVIGLALRES